MMNTNKQTAVFNPISTVDDYASGTCAATVTTKGLTLLYSRLSREDALDGQSLSIQHQQQILEDYAKSQNFANIRHFADDGTSGTRFDREEWQKLIAEVESGNVSILCVKDMSRLGRDHVQVGMYMELFRQRGVRFIAIGNNIDSIYPETLEFAPFINIMSEWYARDTSRKIKAVAHAKGNAGKPLTYKPVYGYRKSPEDKHKWIVDEDAAAVVRRIFQMTIDGMGAHQIARVLTEEKTEKPSYYFVTRLKTSEKPSSRDLSDPYTWVGSTITAMLKKPEYLGHTVNFRTYKESYKDKQSKWNTPDKWKIFENTHEPIISQEVFDTVQRLRKTPRRVGNLGEANPLTGLVFCHDCNAKLYNSRQSKEYYYENRRGKTYRHKTSDHYSCSTYENAKGSFKIKCSNHFIRTVVLRELVLTTIIEVSSYVRDNEAEFVERIREASTVKQKETAAAHKKLFAKNERRIVELDRLFQKVYEDNANSKLSDERYAMLSSTYEQEQKDLRLQNAELQSQLTAYETDSFKADRFIEIVKRYTAFDELTTAMLNEFVEKIIVHEADKSSGQREQQVDIHLNFIGHFELPHEEPPPPTAEELEEEDKRRRRLEYQREANQRHYAKKVREAEWQRALEAGEISPEELEAHQQAQQVKDDAEAAHKAKRTQEKRDYAREWAKNKRARLKAEREAQRLLEPPDSELSPEELKVRKYELRKERERERMQKKREQERAEKAALTATTSNKAI